MGRNCLQHVFPKGELGSTELTVFYYEMTKFVSERRVVYVIYLQFSKAFDTVSYSILVFKLGCYDLDG